MENSTKALIIAGSLLITIVLVTVGIRIIKSTKQVAEKTDETSSSMQTNIFNSQFEAYFGTNVSGIRVKEMLNKIIQNDIKNEDHLIFVDYFPDEGARISSHGSSKPNINKIKEAKALIDDNKKYWIDASSHCTSSTAGYKDGYIYCISISKAKTS